jgi:hypothetical protein
MTIPAATALDGAKFYVQAVVLDPLAGNSAGAVLSDAAAAIIGG